jgi:hypothetical protein
VESTKMMPAVDAHSEIINTFLFLLLSLPLSRMSTINPIMHIVKKEINPRFIVFKFKWLIFRNNSHLPNRLTKKLLLLLHHQPVPCQNYFVITNPGE